MKTKLHFIPGTMCDELIWSQIRSELQHQYELVHIAVPDEPDINRMLAQLVKCLESEQKVNLIGFSMGGYLATCLSHLVPDKINKLLILSNSPCPLPQEEMEQRQQSINWLTQFEYRGITETKINQMLAIEQQQNSDIKQTIRQMEFNLGYGLLVKQLKATSERQDMFEFITAQADKISFCYGDQDKLIDRGWMQRLQVASEITITEVQSCGHMLPLEQPKLLVDVIKQTF